MARNNQTNTNTKPDEIIAPHSVDPILTLTEVAEFCGKTRPTVARWCDDGLLPVVFLGRIPHVRKSELAKLIGASALSGSVS